MSLEFWDDRVKKHGHTGWSDPVIYAFDQQLRVNIVQAFIEKYKLKKHLLDFGCGTGDFSQKLKHCFDNITIYDPSKEVLKIAKKKNQEANAYNDFASLKKDKSKYDCIISITVLQHILDENEFNEILNYFHSSLSDEGVVIILESFNNDHSNYIRSWDSDEFINIMNKNGFCCAEKYDFYYPDDRNDCFRKYRHSFIVRFFSLFSRFFKVNYMLKCIAKPYMKDQNLFLFDYKNQGGSKFFIFVKRRDIWQCH